MSSPMSAKSETLDRSAMSSLSAKRQISPGHAAISHLRNDLVAAVFCHQNLGIGRVALDFLAEPVDMRLKSMGGDAGIVTPDLFQEHVAGNHLLVGTIEIADDRGFLFRQPDLLPVLHGKQLLARLEGIGADIEGRVFALLVLAKLGADAGQQNREAEGLRHIVVGAGLEAENRIGVRVMAGEHDDRGLEAAFAQKLHRLAPIHIRQTDIHDQEIDLAGTSGLNAFTGGRFLQKIELFVKGELLYQGLTQIIVVVDKEDGASRHGTIPVCFLIQNYLKCHAWQARRSLPHVSLNPGRCRIEACGN
ncbi:hypothetical protein EMEDMD4_370194 [Sinorhizobium medicae]|uniref:Uncharacterized protein n=1 Tax=Sinorhizobium medicae TaxID=110321 RepID=A0A508X048_9HYPH|nr:hypothetical protein EMEDMD4_370194 [Sinorhizobium medicae]